MPDGLAARHFCFPTLISWKRGDVILESAQREVVSVLLGRVFSLGLISKSTYSHAEDLVHSVIDLPELFRYSVCLTEKASRHECTENTQ